MPSTTPLAPNQASGFNVPKPATVNPNFDLSKNMTIGQFGMPGTAAGTTTPTLSPVQSNNGLAGSFTAGTMHPSSTTVPTTTGFTAGANNLPVATTAPQTSAWSAPAVTQHPAAQGTNINPNQAMQNELTQAASTLKNMQSQIAPPVPTAPTQTSGAGTGGGAAPFQGNYTFDSQGNVTGQTSATPAQGSNPNPAAQTPQNPANTTAAQTNAIIKNLQDASSQGSQGDPAEQALQDKIQALESGYGTQMGNITGSEMPAAFETGAANVLTQQFNPQLQSLTNQLGQLQANRTASLSAGASAAGASNTLQGMQQQNQAISPGQSLYNLYSGGKTGSSALPATSLSPGQGLYNQFSGQQIGGNATLSQLSSGGAGGIMDTLVQQLKNGASFSDVAAQLPAGIPSAALSQAASAAIPGFNPTTSIQNAGAQNTALQSNATQGLTLQRSAQSASAALDTLSQFYNQLPGATTGGIPASNSISTWLAQQFGNQATSQFETALQDARAQLEGVLTATGASTPTGAEATAKAYLPDGMTPGQFSSKITAAKQLVQQKVSAFTQTGGVPQYQNGTSNNSIGGGSLYQF